MMNSRTNPKFFRVPSITLLSLLGVFLFVLTGACTPQPERIIIVPTLVMLATATETVVDTATATYTAALPITPPATLTDTAIPTPEGTEEIASISLLQALIPDQALTQQTPTASATATVTVTATQNQQFAIEILQQTATALLLTLAPTATATPTPTETREFTETEPQNFYVWVEAEIRECPQLSCAIIARAAARSTVVVTGVAMGQDVEVNNTIWYRIEYGGQSAYIYSRDVAALVPTLSGGVAGSPLSTAVPPGVSMPPVTGSGVCPGLSARCTEMTCEQAMACLAAGNTSLDRDGDGIPCESVCVGN